MATPMIYRNTLQRHRSFTCACRNLFNMSEFKKTFQKPTENAKHATKDTTTLDKLPKRSRKKLRRYHHQLRLEKKSVSADNQQLPSFCLEDMNETDYYYQNGLRKVYPYYFNFSTYVKGRWMKRSILEIFAKEFAYGNEEYYRKAIEEGRVTVNGETVKPDFILGENQLIQHTCHRHENPIIKADLDIVADTEDILVVNKPCSWPIHPCGRYRYNSLLYVLQKDYGYSNLRTMYRLDRLTSGCLILAKNSKTAVKLCADIQQRKVEKEYLARVEGRFPDGTIVCNEPLSCLSFKVSIFKVDPKGKECKTTFTRLSYNGKTSVVKCVPHTGRTHQIRVHLQYLGHPIVNDLFYNHVAFGPLKGKGGLGETPNSEVEQNIMKNHRVELFVIGENPLQKRKLAEKHQRQLESNKQLSESLVTTSTSKPLNDMEYPTNDRLDKVGSLNVNHESMKESLNTDNEAKKDTVNTNSEIVKDAPMLDDNPTGNLAISSTSDKDGKISREMFEFTEMCEETEDVVDSQPPEKRARVCDSDRLQDQSVNVNNCTESMLTECSGSDLEKTKDSTEEIDNENLELEIIDQDEAVNVNNCTESMLTESNGSDLEKTKDSTKEIDNGNLELEIIDQEKVHRATNTEQSTSDNNGSKSIEETSDTSLSNALISNSNEVSDLGLEIIDKEKVHRATNTEQSTSDNNNSKSIEETSDTSLSNAPVSNSNEVSDISNSNEVSDILNSNEVSDLGLAGGQPKVAVVEDYNEEKMYDLIDVGCDNCSVSYKDPTSAELLMFLHAYRYKGPDWEYSVPLPDWAHEDWKE